MIPTRGATRRRKIARFRSRCFSHARCDGIKKVQEISELEEKYTPLSNDSFIHTQRLFAAQSGRKTAIGAFVRCK